jgi:anti-anti-sigma factor
MISEMDPSQFTIEIERAPGVAFVRCRGRLVAGVRDSFYTEVRQLIPDTKRIVLDLTDLTHMDSMGLGTVVRLYVSAKSAGADLELINIGKRVRQILGVTGLLKAFEMIGDQGIRMP